MPTRASPTWSTGSAAACLVAVDVPLGNDGMMVVERHLILHMLERTQRVALNIGLLNNTATAINTFRDWFKPNQ